MSTYSTNLKLELITTGTQAGTWGDTTNTNLGTLLEQAISGYELQACTGGTDVITIPDGATGVARNMYLQLTGTGGGTLVVPVNKKLYFIYNATSTAITVKVTGLTGVSVPAGAKTVLVSNGTDIINATNYMSALTLGAALPVASGGTGSTTASTGTGGVVLATSPTLVTPSISSPTLTGVPLAPTAAAGTNTTQIATTQFVTTGLQAAYPVGAIYMSTVSTIPSTLFGFGTWSAFGAGRVLISQDGTYPAGTQGGSATVTPSGSVSGTVGGTSLTEAQMPKHFHQMIGPTFTTGYPQNDQGGYGTFFGGTPDDGGNAYGTWSTGGGVSSGSQSTGTSNGNSHDHSFSGSFSGSSLSVVQPYISVYMWTRTA